MKIRNGFVSNSSSSSFLLVGFNRGKSLVNIIDCLGLSDAANSHDYEERDEIFNMKRGDFVEIPAGVRHRVDSTSKTEATIWLAIFYAPDKKTPDT